MKLNLILIFQSYVRLAHYELREEIGSGQYGVVKLGVVQTLFHSVILPYTYCIMDYKLWYTYLIWFKTFLTELNDKIQYSGYTLACMYICYNMWLQDYLFRTFGEIIGLILALNRLPYVHNQNIEQKTDILSVFLDIQKDDPR